MVSTVKKNKAWKDQVRYEILERCSCFMWVIRPEESEKALPPAHLEEEYSWLQESKSKISKKTIYVFQAKQDEWKERS